MLNFFLQRLLVGMQMHLRCFGSLVGVIDTGDILDLPRASLVSDVSAEPRYAVSTVSNVDP